MSTRAARLARRRLTVAVALLSTLVVMVAALAGTRAEAAATPVDLGTADSFAVLGGSTVTNTGRSVISGDVGVSPGTAVEGFPPGQVNNGTIHADDAVALQAQSDLTNAYNVAAGQPRDVTVSADLGGQTLVPGVYGSDSSLGLTGTLTLDAQNVSDAVFVFQAGSTLTTATGSRVQLINGANPCNVIWQVGSSSVHGTDSVFVGSVLALTSITADTRASFTGRLLARNAAVTLDSNTISRPICDVPPTTTTTAAPTTTEPTPTTTEPAPTTTEPAPTTTEPAPTTTLPSPTTTAPAPTTTVPGPTTTVPGPTTTVPGPVATLPAPPTSFPAPTTTTTMPESTTATVGRAPESTTTTTMPESTTATVGRAPESTTTTTMPESTTATVGRAPESTTTTEATSVQVSTTVPGDTTAETSQTTPPTSQTTGSLPRTGSPLETTALVGLLALLLGTAIVVASPRWATETDDR